MAQLTAAVTATQRRWKVDEIPDARYVKVDDELVEVRARYPRILTIRVLRGAEDSTPASHDSGATLESPAIGGAGGGLENPVTESLFVTPESTTVDPLTVTIPEGSTSEGLVVEAESDYTGQFSTLKSGAQNVVEFYRSGMNLAPENVTAPNSSLTVEPIQQPAAGANGFTGNIAYFGSASVSGRVVRVNRTAQLAIRGTDAPDDADIIAGELVFYVDSTDGDAKLMIKGKQANGTVVTGEVALT